MYCQHVLPSGMSSCQKTYLMYFPPFPNSIKILALMLGLEIWEGLRLILVEPHLTEHSGVDVAHQDLP